MGPNGAADLHARHQTVHPVTEALIAFEKQTEVWLPENRNQGCSTIGKFCQGAKANGKRLTRCLITDQSGCLVGASERCPADWILTYYDG